MKKIILATVLSLIAPAAQAEILSPSHDCMRAVFVPFVDLPRELAKGLFTSGHTHDAWVRISSGPGKTVGIAFKVLDVRGRKVLKGEENGTAQDFLLQSEKPMASVLDTVYWSGSSMLGKAVVKYSLIPLMPPKSEPIPEGGDQPDFLRERLARDVQKWGGRFELQVQLASAGRPQSVAYVLINRGQSIADNARACERMSFTPWRTLPEHRPLGKP